MSNTKAISLLNRQVTDILSQADRIFAGEQSPSTIEAFARYSEELKNYIISKTGNAVLIQAAERIPVVNYRRAYIKWWQYLILPTWWVVIYQDFHARKDCLREIETVRAGYSSLQLLLRTAMEPTE